MHLKLACGRDLLITDWPDGAPPTVERLLAAAAAARPDLGAAWFDAEGRLRDTLPVFINGAHIRFRDGLRTELREGDEVYVIPLIAGG